MIVDSNILIDFLKGKPEASGFISQFDPILTSVVVVSEEIAKEAGLLRMRYFKSHGLRLPDAFIAATAIVNRIISP